MYDPNVDPLELFSRPRTIAVVGLSPNSDRPSHDVSRVMQQAGFRIVPVNPAAAGQTILGETCYAALEDIPFPVDIVDCFRRSEDMEAVAQAAAALRPLPSVLWMQLGVANENAARLARAAGIAVVQNRCIKIEYFMTR